MLNRLYFLAYGKQSIPLSEEIQEIQNSIEYILYNKIYIGNNTWNASFMIKTKDDKSAQYIKEIIEGAEILQNTNLEVQLQNNQSRNRENLLSISITNDENFQKNLNPKFKNFIDSLMNIQYIDQEYQKVADQTYPLMVKMSNDPEKGLDNSEMEIHTQYYSNAQDKKFIDKKDFVEFLEFCKQNQKITSEEEKEFDSLLLRTKDPKPTLRDSGIESSSSTSRSSSEGSI